MFDEQDRQYFYNEFKNNGYEVGSYDDFKKDLNNKEDRDWYYNEAKNMGYDVGTQADFDKMVLEPAPSTSGDSKQVAASATPQSASTKGKQQVAQPVAKPQTEYPQEVLDAFNSPDNKPGNFKDLAQLNDEYQRGELKKPGIISQALGMFSNVDAGNVGKEQKVGGMIANMLLGDNMKQLQQTQQPLPSNTPSQEPSQFVQMLAEQQQNQTLPQTKVQQQAQNEGLMDAKLANYLEDWKQRPDKEGDYFENMVADLLADGTANSNEEAVKMVQSALGRYANRSAMDVTNQVVSSLPDDTVQDVEQSIEAQWYSHGVQDKLKQEADNMGISYDDYVGQFLKPAMVQSLVNKYGPNYRNIAEGIATRLYAHDEHVQDRLMNQDINDALSSVIKKYVDSSVVDEYNKAQEAGSKAFTEGMEGSQFIPANLRLGTALGAQYKANEAKDPAKVLSGLQNMFGKLYRNPKFLNDMSNAAFKVMQRYGMNGTLSSDPKQFKPMINSVLKNELDQLEIKGMMPKGSAEYIMKTGLGNTIVGKITRKAVQTDYQNWLEDIANQQYQPGFWENVASGALTFAGDAWSYWLPGAAGGKLTKSMLAKAEGRLAGDLMANGMESRMAARAAKLLIGKSKAAALKSGAVHGAVTFGGQSAISKPIDEVYRTGQFDENGKIYNPSGWKIALDTLLEGGKQSALGVIMQGNTIANMIGKGRGLATNILADVGGKVADSGIMTGHQMLERMAQDPNFKPTGKDAAESFLESMANLTAIGLPGMVGKYARFKDAREFNKKYDFTDQDIAELKRFGYDGLRDAFEKVGIDHLVDNSKMAPHSDENRSLDFALKKDYNKYLEQNYMDLMNDLNVSEVLKAKMMAVVEGKYPSSLSPVVNSEVYKGDNGKYYLETYNKNGGVIDRKEYSSHDAARKDEKKLEHEKILNLASVLESELHKEYLDDYLYNLYNQAGQKYFMGEKLNEEEKAAVYLHQNAAAIGDIMQKRQHGYVLTDEEQKQLNAYRHFYNSVEENSKVMRDFVCTFEDSHGVARGTLRKALESNDKKYATLVESYFKELYNSIELKREMKQTENDFNKAENGREQETSEHSDVEAEMSSTDTAAPEPPVSEGSAPYQDRTNSVPSPSDAEFAANPADVANSSAEVSSSENKVATSDAYVMGQNAYKNGDSEALQAINHNDDMAMARLVRAFADSEKMPDIVANAYNEGKDMELFVAQRSGSLTPAQKEAISKYVEAMNAKKGVSDAYLQEDAGYQENLVEQMKPYATEDGNIQMVELDSGKQVYLKKNGESDMVFIVAPDDQGNPVVKTISKSKIVDMGKPIPFDTFINQEVQRHEQQRNSEFLSQFGKDKLTVGEKADLAINLNDTPLKAEIVSINNDGTVSFVLGNSSRVQQVPREDFLKMRNFANTIGINAELDAEDAQRAEKEAIKAEAEKKQRFADGIVGLSEQKPDYSSKETDPKVAAEYLQEQYADNHDQLIKLVNGSRSDIKEQIDNMRKRIVEAEDWLDTNADLEPEQALSREDKLKLAKEQLEDLTTRYDNWNKIRSLIMTEEEKRELKDERTANIKKVGIDKEALTVTDEREVPVLTDEELKKQYPAMDEASDYILSQRKEISKTQEELHRQLEDIDARLNQYLRGEADLTDEEIRDFNTTKADLEARQANLTESAKELKAQADKLKKLYVQENKKERAAILAEMTPAEQRRVKAEQYLKDGNISGLMKLYGDTSVDFTDNHPNTVDEYVATSIGRFTLNYEGREVDGTFLNGLQQELGGSRKDFDKKQILAAEGKGQTFDKFVNELYDNLPDNLRNQGVNTQEIRNSLLALLRGAEKYSDLKNYILKDKIAKAEEEMRPMDLAEEEQRIAYEENENVPLDEDTKSFDVANSLSAKVGQSLSKEEADNLVAEMEEHAEPVRDLELTPDNWLAEFGEDGKVTTPLGEVKMGENQLAKLFMKGREAEFGLIKPTLSDPDVVIEETSHASTGEEERPSSYLFVKTFERDGKKIKFYASVSVKHDGMEVVISNHFMNKKAVDKKMQEGKMLYIKGASTSNSSDNHLAEHQNGVPDLLPTQEVDALNSESKDTNNFGNLQENSENFSERLKNAIAETETEPTEAQKKAGNYKKGHLTFGGYDFTVETPKGVTRSGKDEQGKPWSVTMHDTYGYILGKIGVDGDHIDMFINDAADLDTFDGNVYVVDQINPETGEFDEHKVMYGYPSEEAATEAYLANYSKDWKGLGKVTSVPKATFDKWLQSSDRKTKPFADYAMIKKDSDALSSGQKDENLPFAQMNMDDLPFHRDVKEVKPSEMTEAQKVAYDAVSTMLKKAGIPVKVVSNEDMEKVAEAQDNLNLAMLLNQPEMRFKIKTPEEKKAAENAYNFAKELRPNKWAQYAVVDMSNPNKMPEYYQKQELARKERTYLNRLMWGNYKVFNLDKSFEDNVAGLTGSFPSEFDPYKIDAQTSKKNELKKQMKETEEAYKLTGQERKEYQNQLMKEYMDEHGLASENDIPDDVWREFDYKAIEKYQDKLDSLFAKYKDLDRQLKAIVQPGVQYLKGKGVVYGYTDGKEIVLNQEHLNPNTPIHEYQHLWRTAAKEMNPELIAHGDELIKQTQLFRDLKEDPNYMHLSDDEICDEAFARLTGEDGAAILEQMAKDAIKENPLDTAKELTIINRLKNWLKKFWYWTLDTFTKWKPEDIQKMTLEDIRNLVLRDLANGVDPRNVKSRMTKEDAVSLRKQMEDNAEQERILEHTEENWLKEFGKDSRVTTPIGSIKLGENQYKKAGRNDRIKRFGLLKPTLERPDVILEKSAPKEDAERQTKYLFIKSFKKADGNKILNYESITVKQGEEEVAISAHQIEPSKVVKELTESRVLWNRFRGDSNSLGENQGSALTPSANNPSGKDSVLNPHSDAKIRNSFEITKENGGNLSVEDKIKAVSQQFGVDEADVAMYANAVKKGSTAEAARARANIKRHLLQANEDKISSFKELLKYTVPVNNALKENFGDLDAMIEERKKQVEAQRNAMEAARKRAEEEEAKRKKHLEELSLIPDDQLDKQYMDALAKGDDATAREMLDEAARRKGYDDTESAYQGVGAWAAPGNPGYESDKARRDDWESSGSDVNLEDMALGYTPQPDDYFSHPERYSQNTPHGLESVKAINTAIDAIKNGEKDVKVKVYRAVPTSVKEGKLRNGDWVTPSKKYADIHGNNRLEGKYRIIEDEVPATQLWWDGNDANEFGFDDGKAYKYKNAKNNRKLNDLVTYDDKGDVIPPSHRFNSRKQDVRFHRVTEPEELERLNKEKTFEKEKARIASDAKEKGSYMLAPNGKKSKLDAEQWATVRTTNFKKRFGDWENDPENASKVVDENGEPLEAIDAQVQDHGSHSNDSISGTNLLKKVEMSYDKGKKLLDESEKMGISIENQRKIADSVVNTANKLGGAEATVYSSLDDVPEEYRSEVEQGAKGWYDPETHTVHVYLPNCEDGNDAQRTVFHEKIGHEGMEVLLGGEDEVRKFANFVYNSVAASTRGKILEIANEYDPDWKKHDRMNVGTQEYIARLAEEGPKTAEDFSLWTKIKHYLIRVLKKLGIRVPGLLNDKDLRYYLMKAGKALHVWDDMPEEKQEAMMKQATNAEIKDALGEGADLPSEGDNKLKKKTERGRIDEATGAFKLAPNGEQSNLSKKQYIEARTKNFKVWFGGDWEKKPKDFKNKLDANGEPLEKYVEGYLNRPKKPTMPKKRKGEDEATFFGRKMLYSQALEDWPKTEADWKKRIDEFDENTLAALTPPDEEAIREKYQKQYENDMASWRKDHPYIKEGEERPLEIPDMRNYQSIQDYGEALRKHEIWKTAPHKDEYDRMAEDEIISKVALMDAVQHPFSEYARLKAMKAEFQHMRHVMQNQKVYDQNTTDAVVQFAKRFMSLGYGDDLGRGSINTLLTIVKNSTGRKSHEIPQQLYQVMDVLMNNQLRNFDRAVMKTMSIKELKENAKGIQVQGKLELRGQTTIKAFRDAVSSRISSDKLDEKISNLIDKMTDDRKNASSYQDELLGLNLAKQYVDYIDSSRNDAIEIEDLKKLEVENYKNRKGIYKGELTKALLQEHMERLNQYDEALFNNKVERMDRYSQLLANLGGMIDESVKGAREFQERDARRAINVKMMASADLGDKSMNQHHKENWKTRLSNSDVARLFCSPLGSFDALMREFGSKQINGEGQLWNHFVRGAMKASNDEFKSVREANNEIDLKVSELFGKVTEDKNGNKKGNMILNDLYALERSNKVKSLDVTIRDIEGEQTYKLQQGNLMYIYMVNKMPDGAMKLREMGILDADVERIKENIDPRFLKLADWIQGEFLPKMRTKYNKRHEELFGAPMPMVENYFPLRVLKNARYMEEDVNNTSDGSNALPSTATGAIIKRKTNKLPLDILNSDALSVTIDNIKEMENWYNYAPIRKDANTLLSDTTFRNRVQNMTTIYGSGERLWNNVKDATAVAMGTYRPKGGTDLAVSLKNFGKGITGAKISGRLYTAFKQVLSAPLFLPDVDLGRFVRHSVYPYGSFKWAIENLPNFDKRWSGRKLGDTVLMDDPTDWKLWHTNLMEKAAYYGMTPNALVDAVTCAVGARAVYDTKYKQYIKYGLTEERAKEKALSDAEINFNTSQQSSEGAFVSPMQLDRTLESAIFTPFRNSSMLYERKGINALRNLKHRFEKGHKEASIKFMAGQLMDEGVGYNQATKAAEKMYQKGLTHNIADAIVALWLGPIIWNLGGNLGYLLFGKDKEKKKKMVLDAVILGLLEGPVDGLAGGQFINTAIANTITSDGINLKGLKNVDFSGMPMLSDFNSMIEKFGYDKVAGAQDLMFMVMQSATGFNPKTLTDAINACIDYGNGDMTNAKEIALFVFRLMNGPAATVDNLYIDELGMKGKDAKKLSYEELAKRYAEYKFGKNTFGLGKLYSEEEKQKKLKAIEKSFDKKVSERLAGMDREDLKNEFSESRSQKEKKLIGKIIADELGTKDSEAVKKAKADASYLRQRNFSDLMDDLFLQQEWESTKTAQDGLDDLKGNGATDEEIKSYKLHHKIELDKRKAIEAARKAMGKEKKNLTSDNDTQVMAKIRAERDKVLIPLRKQKSEK